MSDMQNINWYPGHMAKASRMITRNLSLVNGVCEIIDARIPASSRNPEFQKLCATRPILLVLNRVDLADPVVTAEWRRFYKSQNVQVLETDSASGAGIGAFPAAVRRLLKSQIEENEKKGQGGRPMRVMVVGIPNSGKSTFINKVSKRKSAKASDRPGVTRGEQWITVDSGLELLDTPGILPPKIDSQKSGEYLAFTGAIKDEILDRMELAARLLVTLREKYPAYIEARYKFAPRDDATGHEMLEELAKRRGFLISGGELDLERASAILLDEFRGGKLGRISLERYGAEDLETETI